MTSRRWSVLAWGLFAFAVGCAVVGWVLAATAGREVLDLAPFTLSWSFPLVGALIASRQPRNAIGWIFIATGAVISSQGLLNVWGGLAFTEGDTSFPARLAYWYATWAWFPPLVLIAPFTFLLFPDGRLPTTRWRWVAWLGGLGGGLVLSAQALMPWEDPGEFGTALDAGAANPFGLQGRAGELEIPLILGAILLLIALPGGVAAAIVRFRRSRGVERQQLKLMTFAVVVAAVAYVVSNVAELVGSDIVLAITLPLIPAAAGYAILRHRLYDIDVIINRALVYAVLTLGLAGLYVASVIVLGYVLRPLTRDSDIAVAASTLAIAAAFRPLRGTIQSFIDKGFYRRRYDAARSVAAFSSRLRVEVDLDRTIVDLVGVVEETVQPRSVSLWVVPARSGGGGM